MSAYEDIWSSDQKRITAPNLIMTGLIMNSAEMPLYECHKKVHALRIKKVRGVELVVEESGFAPVPVGQSWIDKHNPEPGGYYVVYQDGYTSYSPAKAFESGYTRLK